MGEKKLRQARAAARRAQEAASQASAPSASASGSTTPQIEAQSEIDKWRGTPRSDGGYMEHDSDREWVKESGEKRKLKDSEASKGGSGGRAQPASLKPDGGLDLETLEAGWLDEDTSEDIASVRSLWLASTHVQAGICLGERFTYSQYESYVCAVMGRIPAGRHFAEACGGVRAGGRRDNV